MLTTTGGSPLNYMRMWSPTEKHVRSRSAGHLSWEILQSQVFYLLHYRNIYKLWGIGFLIALAF